MCETLQVQILSYNRFFMYQQLGNIGNIGVQSMLGHATTLAIMMLSL